jgi:hypothetical protein
MSVNMPSQRLPLRPGLSPGQPPSALGKSGSGAVTQGLANPAVAAMGKPDVARFSGLPVPKPTISSGLLRELDFSELAQSHITQIQLVYASCIASRIGAAYYRSEHSPTKSRNEIRESILRDGTGYLFWFFATPIVQRLFLRAVTPQPYKDALLHLNPSPEARGIWGILKKANWMFNPIARYTIPSSRQVGNHKAQALHDLVEAGIEMGSDAYKKTENYYKTLTKYRNFATAVGLGMTILLIGIGINLLNFYLTNQNVAKQRRMMGMAGGKTPTPANNGPIPSPNIPAQPVLSNSFSTPPTMTAVGMTPVTASMPTFAANTMHPAPKPFGL